MLDPTQPAGVRIMAARTALPFLLPKREEQDEQAGHENDLLKALEAGRESVKRHRGSR